MDDTNKLLTRTSKEDMLEWCDLDIYSIQSSRQLREQQQIPTGAWIQYRPRPTSDKLSRSTKTPK